MSRGPAIPTRYSLPAGLQTPIPSVKIVGLLPNCLDPVEHPGAREAILLGRDIVVDPPAVRQGRKAPVQGPVDLVQVQPAVGISKVLFPVHHLGGLGVVVHYPAVC